MKRILIVKLTSLGDLIHTLPAISDVHRIYPDLAIDWMIDESFQEVALFHPAIRRIYTTNHRKWLKNWSSVQSHHAIYKLLTCVRKTKYDLIIDAQGNYKSAFLTLFSKGRKAGYDRLSAPEKVASIAYHNGYFAPKVEHAIHRLRRLFSLALSYPFPLTDPDYGIDIKRFSEPSVPLPADYVTFIHSAGWQTKLWPESHWQDLIQQTIESGYKVLLPWGSPVEEERAKRLQISKDAIVLPKLTLKELGYILQKSKAAVSVDTGLSHLAAALNIPCIDLYGPTPPNLIGAFGKNQLHLQSNLPCTPCNKKHCKLKTDPPQCLASLSPSHVFHHFQTLLNKIQYV